jgi:hypothetical protein
MEVIMNLLEKSPLEMTPEELRECHVLMWDWLAETAMRSKGAYFLENGLSLHEKELECLCYACVLAVREAKEKHGETDFFWQTHKCMYCPCEWSEKELSQAEQKYHPCECMMDSPYLAWMAATHLFVPNYDVSRVKKFALLIRDAWK